MDIEEDCAPVKSVHMKQYRTSDCGEAMMSEDIEKYDNQNESSSSQLSLQEMQVKDSNNSCQKEAMSCESNHPISFPSTSSLAPLSSQTSSFSSSSKNKRKYVKKSFAKFFDTRIAYDAPRSMQLTTTPVYQSIKEPISFILIGGDFLFDITRFNNTQSLVSKKALFSSPSSAIATSTNKYISKTNSEIIYSPEEHQHLYKEIVDISKTDSFINVKIMNKVNGILDFRGYIAVINEMMTAFSGENHIDQLVKFQEYIDRSSSMIHKIIQLYPDYNALIALQQRRQLHIKEIGRTSLEQMYRIDSDFLVVGLSMINFHQRIPTLQNICFNKPLVSLIGSDFEQLQSYFLRKGLMEFFDFETRLLMQQQHIRSIINKKSEFLEQPFTLITYDDYKIPCRIRIESVFAEMPDELKYDKNGEDPFELHEGGFVIQILLSDSQIEEITQIRQNYAREEEIKKEEDIGYSMQSQYLLEKYYPTDFKKIMLTDPQFASYQQTVKEEENLRKAEYLNNESLRDPFNSIRCKFKPIPQQQ